MQQNNKPASPLMVILAFLTVYVVWGSTYFFIKQSLTGFPPFILGAVRFLVAGLIMFFWCLVRREKLFNSYVMRHAAVGGVLMLFIGNGMVIWVEQSLPSAMAAIMVSSAPLWFVILDKPKWTTNFRDAKTISGLLLGFFGVLLLFSEHIFTSFSSLKGNEELVGLLLLSFSVTAWAGGSLYVKYKIQGVSPMVNTTWQILAAGIAFIPGIFLMNEPERFQLSDVSPTAWASLWFLILLGSVMAFSAYVWLLQVRPATQVSTHAYVNPVVAVLLGVLLGGEKITLIPVAGLTIILVSVLMINMVRSGKK